MKKTYMKHLLVFAIAMIAFAGLRAQCSLNCGTGVDGAYTASSSTTLASGTYNYTSFTIDAGVTVTVTGNQPLIIRCTGNVQINGTLNVSGANGVDGVTYTNGGAGGAGVATGSNGGAGSFASGSGPIPGTAGGGAGSGGAGGAWSGGGGAGYALVGGSTGNPSGGFGGPAYGNAQISPAVAGSGGAGGSGGYDCGAGGGGGGGGYVSISACGAVTIAATGNILANGGDGGSDGTGNCGGGGGGSGGSVLVLTSAAFANNGLVSAAGGAGGASQVPGNPYYGVGGNGSEGRVVLSYTTLTGTGTVTPAASVTQALSGTASATAATCFNSCNGTLSATANGGIPGYTYAWMPGNLSGATVSNVCPGTYTLTVTDANTCTSTATVNVTAPPAITIAPAVINAGCMCDGAITANVTGGSAPYSYLWTPLGATTPTVTGLCVGCYTVTVTDANGCTQTLTACITAPPALSSSATQVSNVSCNGLDNGSATVLTSGGSGTYSYSWTPAACNASSCSNLAPAQYSVVTTDSLGCTVTTTFTITEPDALTATPTSSSVACFGDCSATLTASATGGTPAYTYLWMPGNQTQTTVSNQCAGTYTLTATDANGCVTTTTTTITAPSQLTVTATGTDETNAAANDGTATATGNGGTPAYTYVWMPGNQTTATATGLNAGTYTCTITDANGCTTTTTVTIGTMSDVNSLGASLLSVTLFPNPAQDHIMVQMNAAQKGNTRIELYNVIGEKIDAVDFGTVSNVNYDYATSQLANGVYFFRITSGAATVTRKVTVSH